MRIGIDCRIYSSRFTGLGRYTHEIVERIIKLNNKLANPHQLILFFNNPEYENFRSPKNVKKILVNARHYSLAEQFTFLKKLNAQNLDLVHFPHFNVPILYDKPYIVTIHDLTLSLFPGQKMTKWYHRLGYNLTIKNAVKKAKKIIAVSENTKKDLIKLLNVQASKIKVIYNGISENFCSRQGPRKTPAGPVGGASPFFLYAGVWRSHKNLPRLIQAFKILKTKHPDLKNLKLIITGKPDPHYPEVKNTVKKLHLQNDVIFPGLVTEKELINLYCSASIFVFHSLYEGFGLPPLEAMACGTPVAASNSSSIPEICGAKNAIYFDPHNINDIAKKLYLLYENKALQEKLIKNGLSRSTKFSWALAARKTFKIIPTC
ncbi:MAG: glycosyltransferase family 1 protein, partial [Patescibacteria group bacterium]